MKMFFLLGMAAGCQCFPLEMSSCISARFPREASASDLLGLGAGRGRAACCGQVSPE